MLKKRIVRQFAAAAFVLAAALIFATFFGGWTASAASAEITETYVGYYDQYHHGELQMHYQAKMHKLNGEMAYCISMTKTSEPGSAKEVNIGKFLPGDELVMACLAQKHIFEMDQYSTNEKYMLTQCMVWYIQRDHIGDGGWRQYVSDIDMSVSEQKKFFAELEETVKAEAPRYEGHGTAWENVDVDDVQEVGILLAPTLKTGELSLGKVSERPEITGGNKCYSLAGAEYGVYRDGTCTDRAALLTTGEDGNSQKVTLEIGTYYVRETKAPQGYLLDTQVYTVTVEADRHKTFQAKEAPAYSGLVIELEKLDRELEKAQPLGAAELAGAEFTVCYYDGFYTEEDLPDYDSYESAAKRKWILRTVRDETSGEVRYYAGMEEPGCRAGGDEYYTADKKAVIPNGTITVEETKAPEGYLLRDARLTNVQTGESTEGKYIAQIRQESSGTEAVFKGGNRLNAADRVIRGDLRLRKVDGDNDHAMSGVAFRLTSVTTGESHVFVTDENGEYSTSSSFIRHSENTNGGNAGDGIWFGVGEDGIQVPTDDTVGALPYDTYELEEIAGKNNQGMVMYKGTVVIRRDETVVDLDNLENFSIVIQTTARDRENGTHYSEADDSVEIIDAVEYENVKKNTHYRMEGTLMDRETLEPICDSEGEPVTGETEFQAQQADGEIDVAFSMDASSLAGRSVVIYEELYEIKEDEDAGETEVLAAEHKDPDSEEQTIYLTDEEQPVRVTTAAEDDTPHFEEGGETVQTGDESRILLPAAGVLVSAAVLAAVRRRRRRRVR